MTLNEIYNNCQAEGSVIHPPAREYLEIPRDLYAEFKKTLTDNLGKWKGGRGQYFEFPFETQQLLDQLRAGKRPNYKQDWHYFPTPEPVLSLMLHLHIPGPDAERILEPSAGRGAIVEYVNQFIQVNGDHQWTTIEPEPQNRVALAKLGFEPVWDDFDTFETNDRFDLIYANPPFRRIAQHVEKFADLLDHTGSFVTVVPANFETKHADVVERLAPRFESLDFYEVPEGSFKPSTGVSTAILAGQYLDKATPPALPNRLSALKSIKPKPAQLELAL